MNKFLKIIEVVIEALVIVSVLLLGGIAGYALGIQKGRDQEKRYLGCKMAPVEYPDCEDELKK